jgi:cytochrome c biogenesis factor
VRIANDWSSGEQFLRLRPELTNLRGSGSDRAKHAALHRVDLTEEQRRLGLALNPILQDPVSRHSPPLLYLGYVGLSISFSFAIAAQVRAAV